LSFDERSSVQNPILRYAQRIGWTYLTPDDSLRLRGGETGLIHRELFTRQLMKFNSDFADRETANSFIKKFETEIKPDIGGNFEIWNHLQGNRTIFVPEQRRDRNAMMIDFDNIERNEFHVTEEFSYTNGTVRNRPDIVFMVNGIPLFVLEAKAPHRLEGKDEALVQVKRYHEETPEMMKIPQSYQISNAIDFFYGPTWNFSSNAIFSWRLDPSEHLEQQIMSFFDKARIIELIRNGILFARQDDELKKAVLRPHQLRATDRLTERCSSPKRRGLIWHTQGSGKTYTMIIAAKKIMQLRFMKKPIILLIVDRNELESQLFSNLSALGFENAKVTESKKDLSDLLSRTGPQLVVTTIQKFEGIPSKLNASGEIYVFVDEAHRSTGGKLGNYMMGALPNATYIGFTGTPVSRTSGKNDTFIMFGREDPEGYLDKYGIKESIRDGTTLPLNYSLAPNHLQVDRDILEREFLNNADLAGVSDIEALNRIMEKQVTLRNMMKNRERMENIARYVAEHFKSNVEPMGFKAFLVAVDREACSMYKDILDRYLPPEYSKVIISGKYNDLPDLKRFHTSEDEERIIRRSFRDPGANPKILIVTEKLLTGFDAPVLYCMYLDKPMRDHVLLQTIARINRPYDPGKTGKKKVGLIIDFVGVFGKLKKALAFDSRDVSDIEDVIQDITVLKDSFSDKISNMLKEYGVLDGGTPPDQQIGIILDAFIDPEKRQRYYAEWNELQDIYDIISPDEFLREFLDDYEKLARIYNILKQFYDNSQKPDVDLSRKTAELVRNNTKPSDFKEPRSVYSIDENTLNRIRTEHNNDTERILSMINSILTYVNENLKREPYLISIGERAEEIAKQYKQGQEASEQIAKELESLINKVNDASSEKKDRKMPPDIFTVYWMLKNDGIAKPEEAANAMIVIFEKYPNWRTNPRQERDIRLELNRVINNGTEGLNASNVQKNASVAKQIIDRLKVAGNGK